MAPEGSELEAAVAELDDSYLKVMLTLAVRRAQSEEPRRAGFWHALAVTLAEEQEVRRSAAELEPAAEATAVAADESPDLQAVLDELRQEIAAVEAEVREASGHMARIDPEDVG
jgi:hypothetical protein